MTGLSLAAQLAQLEDTAPADFDPEEDHWAARGPEDGDGGGDADEVDPSEAARAHYVDVGPSKLRAANASISDPKYEGVRTTRRKLEDAFSGQDSDMSDEGVPPEANQDDESDDNNIDPEDGPFSGEDGPFSGGDGSSSGEDGPFSGDDIRSGEGEDDEEEDEYERKGGEDVEISESLSARDGEKLGADVNNSHGRSKEENEQTDGAAGNDSVTVLQKTRSEEIKKGKAVVRQIAIWDSLLDARIRLQKCVSAMNQLPHPLEIAEITSDPEVRPAVSVFLETALSFAEDLFELQEELLRRNESIQPPPRKKRRVMTDSGESPVERNFEADLAEATRTTSALEHAMHPHLVRTLQKWSSKVQAVAPSVLLPSIRPAFSSKQNAPRNVVQLIDDVLVDSDKLLARTRIKRVSGDAKDADDSVDVEVFDDTDFYQQLLRDVIDSRTEGGARDDWLNIQRQRKSQKKKTVDTKASKGRKLRYEVHEKLQNFMVPVPVPGSWHEGQIDELFASLLGRGFEVLEPPADSQEISERMDQDLQAAVTNGFRVFG